MEKQILFISDGSASATKAGAIAIELAATRQSDLRAVFILDEGWGSLLGDEWINTSDTRMKFFSWFEGELKTRAEQVLNQFSNQAVSSGVKVETAILTGKTEKVIAEAANNERTVLLVLPNPNSTEPAAAAGLRFNLHHLAKKVTCPILLGPQ
ncbi:MAG TPA: universal stress protein [Desulfotomaculum sp.]|nr:MAG: universal stress protein [Peptococcaceae bacterium BRH_c8a]KJS75545.1 MAG: universal stress protein [Desulfotomaculum sp. BICA1-6]HBX23284.1 universal stress protein [Desulfotomaculum sp.]